MKIIELQLLPPLAFARFGSADEPLENYSLTPDPLSTSTHLEKGYDPLGFRAIVPEPTLVVDKHTGRVEIKPASERVSFKKNGKVKPVAPFFELFAVTDESAGQLVAVDLELLERAGLDPSHVKWTVAVANRKVWRRTGDECDIVEATVDLSLPKDWRTAPSPRKPLEGRCRNETRESEPGASHACDDPFAGKAIPFGHVQCIVPNTSHPVCTQIRLRFTPAEGRIYGPLERVKGVPDDAGYVTPIYQSATPKSDAAVEDQPPEWPGWEREEDDREHQTLPPDLFAIVPPAPPWLHGNKSVSRGYLDDACDGFIEARLVDDKGKTTHLAKARIGVAPPLFVPDAVFIRSLADDLEQVDRGPAVADETPRPELQARAEEFIRRASEAVRSMNVAVMNGNPVKGRSPLEFDTMPAEEAFDTERPIRPIMAPHSVDTLSILDLHRRVLAALRAGTAPWFLRFLREPEEAADLTDKGRRKMPALMCGADGFYLALTRRQLDTIRQAAGEPRAAGVKPAPAPAALSPRNRMAEINHRAAGNPANSRPASAIANCCPGLEFDFRAVWKRLFNGIELMEYDNYVVDAHGKHKRLKHHRLLAVAGKPVVAQLIGPRTSDPTGTVPIATEDNPEAALTLEWSNNFAHILHRQGEAVDCVFTADESPTPVLWTPEIQAKNPALFQTETLTVSRFFDAGSSVISEQLAPAGTLTQGLCSPWQNDLRECSCYYWASSRPDYVNVEPGPDGLSRGDNWMQRERTGEYVPDSYSDPRLITYDELFRHWEKLLKFQIGGRDEDKQPSRPDIETKTR